MPDVRVMTFGYDADVVRAIDVASSNTVRDHGKALATELARKRLFDGCKDRHLIFVAHSLGGLVCEQALLISHGAAEPWLNAILTSTFGIMFLGTPHAGNSLADWTAILTNISKVLRPTNKALIGVLRPGSEMLAALQQEFHGLIRARQSRGESVPQIFCFFEELSYAQGIGFIVPRHSAILPQYGNQGIHANHIGMTKFSSRSDQGYQNVSGQLRIWRMEIEEIITRKTDRNDHRLLPDSSTETVKYTYSGNVYSGEGIVVQGDMTSSKDINLSVNKGQRS